MKKITDAKELRKIQLDILSYVDEICREYNIKYSIAGGTLIGAIRHRGYIPWDDDIDIMLTRENYNKLIEILQNQHHNKNIRYKILTANTTDGYYYPFAKVVDDKTLLIENLKGYKNFGIFIDVFPIDRIDIKNSTKILFKMRLLYNMLILKTLKISRHRFILKNLAILLSQALLYPFSLSWIVSMMDSNAQKSSKTESSNRCCLVWGYGKREIVPYSIHESHIDLPFEDRVFMAIKDYNTYLTNLYNDYMKLPPIEQQKSHHDFEAFWK